MSKQDDRAQKITDWLQHLRGWRDSGKSLAAYAKEHGLALWAMYHWRGLLIREGHWHQESKASAKSRSRSPLALRFAKVDVMDLRPPMPVTVRLLLANGRRAEIDVTGDRATRRGPWRAGTPAMMRPAPDVTVYLCVAPVDMREQAASLALLVEQSLGHNVFDASLYVFTNRKRDRVRIVYWERNGLCLWSKRVEKQQFIWPRLISGETVAMNGRELNALLDGFDVWVWGRGHRALDVRRVG